MHNTYEPYNLYSHNQINIIYNLIIIILNINIIIIININNTITYLSIMFKGIELIIYYIYYIHLFLIVDVLMMMMMIEMVVALCSKIEAHLSNNTTMETSSHTWMRK